MAYLLAKTKQGRLSAIFIAVFFLCFALMQILVAAGQTGGEGFPGNLFLFIPGVIGAAFGVAAFFTGLFSIIRKRERGILVFAVTFIGLLITIFVLGEIIVPH